MTTAKDIIVNALSESGLCNRNDAPEADLYTSARILLNNRVSLYSNSNLLEFIRKDISFIPREVANIHNSDPFKITIGEYLFNDVIAEDHSNIKFGKIDDYSASENANVYLVYRPEITALDTVYLSNGTTWEVVPTSTIISFAPDVLAYNISEVTRCRYMVSSIGNEVVTSNSNYFDLSFVSFEDFKSFFQGRPVYSYKQVTDYYGILYLKSLFINMNINIVYNELFDLKDDTKTIHIPNVYISLFTAALVYDLTIAYPRIDSTTASLIKTKLDNLEANISRSSSVNKFLGRINNRGFSSWDAGINGTFLL